MKEFFQRGHGRVPQAGEHQQVWELLPWLINGTASADQLSHALGHLAICTDCRQELIAQQQLQRAMASELDDGGGSDAEEGLARLLERIEASPVQDQPAPGRGASLAEDNIRGRRLTFALAVAVVVQAVGLGLLSMQLTKREEAVSYRTLSQSATTAPAATLRDVPAPGLTLAEWQTLLQVHGLRVVDGPNAGGAYALAPAGPVTPVAEQLRQLRAMSAVRLAEVIGPAQ